MSTIPSDNSWFERSGHVVLGTTARSLGAFPSGWRMPGAHNDPAADARALARLARTAEAAHLDFVFIGDWLSTGPELETTEPYLLARTEPISTASFLLAKTRRIGIVATMSIAVSEPYSVARISASIDRLSSGRFGLNLLLGADARAQANFGRTGRVSALNVFDEAEEFVDVLRGLWDSFGPEAFVRDARRGRLIDSGQLAPIEHDGAEFSVAGALNVLRPPQGHVPLVHSGTSVRSRDFAARHADIHLVDPTSLGDAIEFHHEMRGRVRAESRDEGALTLLAPLMPIVAATRAEAWDVYDRLVERVSLDDTDPAVGKQPASRGVPQLLRFIGIPLTSHRLEETVSPTTAGKFNAAGRYLLEVVRARSGRVVGSKRAVSYRHLLVAQLVRTPIIVGAPEDIADHIEEWYRASAVDGFMILSAYLHEQFDAFASTVVPLLTERGLFRADYDTSTLRGHLGRPAPERRPRVEA
ncbi:NtaA/DmoA family FMN-dependent monooxygenase [Microbacteriaceae bacterium VKM Ac-2855]|nr:NtaA/DmoA family FMN-dependent monooxygenase [Microbacteriaceae bacterium VKM Ac-2855]